MATARQGAAVGADSCRMTHTIGANRMKAHERETSNMIEDAR